MKHGDSFESTQRFDVSSHRSACSFVSQVHMKAEFLCILMCRSRIADGIHCGVHYKVIRVLVNRNGIEQISH